MYAFFRYLGTSCFKGMESPHDFMTFIHVIPSDFFKTNNKNMTLSFMGGDLNSFPNIWALIIPFHMVMIAQQIK
jgi:hypothetical protein